MAEKVEPVEEYRPRIRDLPSNDRPRERLEREGPSVLSNAELLAILLRVGVAGENAVRVAERLLAQLNGLPGLHRAGFSDLKAQRGIGPAKAARTLANKHKTQKAKIYAKYKRTSEQGVKALIVEAPNPNRLDKPYQAKLGDKPIRTTFSTVIQDEQHQHHLGRTELVRRLFANTCELCGSQDTVEVHHVHRLADVKKRYGKSQVRPDWAKFMLARNRKTVVACHTCHQAIHRGTYDGRSVNGD